MTDDRLMKKPLKDHLTGLLNRVDRLPDDRIRQTLKDCILFVLAETPRIDRAGRHL